MNLGHSMLGLETPEKRRAAAEKAMKLVESVMFNDKGRPFGTCVRTDRAVSVAVALIEAAQPARLICGHSMDAWYFEDEESGHGFCAVCAVPRLREAPGA